MIKQSYKAVALVVATLVTAAEMAFFASPVPVLASPSVAAHAVAAYQA